MLLKHSWENYDFLEKKTERKKKPHGKNIMPDSAKQGGHKKINPGIVASYDIRLENGEGPV